MTLPFSFLAGPSTTNLPGLHFLDELDPRLPYRPPSPCNTGGNNSYNPFRDTDPYKRLLRATEESQAHMINLGKRTIATGIPPQTAWEETALRYTEKKTGLSFRPAREPTFSFPTTPIEQPPVTSPLFVYTPPFSTLKLLDVETPAEHVMRVFRADRERESRENIRKKVEEDLNTYLERNIPGYRPPKAETSMLAPLDLADPFVFPKPYRKKEGGSVHYPGNDLWTATAKDGGVLIGAKGLGTHTHIGTDSDGTYRVSVRDETTGRHPLQWRIPDVGTCGSAAGTGRGGDDGPGSRPVGEYGKVNGSAKDLNSIGSVADDLLDLSLGVGRGIAHLGKACVDGFLEGLHGDDR